MLKCPKFKFKFFEKYNPTVVNELKTKLKNEFNALNDTNNNNNSNNNNSQGTNTTPPSDLSLSFFDSDEEDNDSNASEFLNLLESFSSVEDLKLKKFKNIEKLFLKYNSAMPSSASVERLFSAAKRVLSPSRMSLRDDNFEMQLLLHQNVNIK